MGVKEDYYVHKKQRFGELEHVTKFEKVCVLVALTLCFAIAVVLSLSKSQAIKLNVNHVSNLHAISIINAKQSIYHKTCAHLDELENNLKNQELRVRIVDEKLDEIELNIDKLLSDKQDTTLYNETKQTLENLATYIEDIQQECKLVYDDYTKLQSEIGQNSSKLITTISDGSNMLQLGKVQTLSYENASYESTSNIEFKSQDFYSYINSVQIERFFSEMRYVILSERLEEYEKIIEFENMKSSLKEKLSSIEISKRADVSKVTGFTEEELRYLLECSGLIDDPEIIATLPEVVVETVKQYPVNELWSIAVMCLESGYFTSNLAIKHNNYGGMLYKGKAMRFDTMEEGIQRAIQCFYNNLKGDNTIYEVNETYCEPDENGKYGWSYKVMDVLSLFVSTEIN